MSAESPLKARIQQTLDLDEIKAEAEVRARRAQAKVGPAKEHFSKTLNAHPVITTFAALFTLLATLPIGLFALYAVFSAGAIMGIALLITLFVVGAALAVLIAVLVGLAIAAGFGTAWVAGFYLAYRLASNISQAQNLGEGVQRFTLEMRGLISGERPPLPIKTEVEEANGRPSVQYDDDKTTLSSGSSGSPILDDGVKHEGASE